MSVTMRCFPAMNLILIYRWLLRKIGEDWFILQLTILSISERIFKSFVVGADNLNPDISSSKYLRLKMTNFIMSELSDKVKDVFTELFYHHLDYHNDISEDFHSTQIKKLLILKFETFPLWAGIFKIGGPALLEILHRAKRFPSVSTSYQIVRAKKCKVTFPPDINVSKAVSNVTLVQSAVDNKIYSLFYTLPLSKSGV